MGVLAIVVAYLVPHVLKLILYAYTFGAAGIFAPTVGLLFWRRATAAGALWSILAGGSTAVAWTLAGDPWGLSASYCGWLVSFAVLILVSLCTAHHPEEDVESFF
jgi:SSS family solute:Na+ symporter